MTAIGDKLALVISYTREIGDKGQVHFQTTVAQDIGTPQLEGLADKLHRVGRRLAIQAQLEGLQSDLEHLEQSEGANMAEVHRLTNIQNSSPKLRTDDQNKLQQAQANIVAADAIREKITSKIAAIKLELIKE